MLVWRQWLGQHWILGVWVEGPWVIVVVPSIQCFRNSMGWACYASSKAGWRSVVAVVVWSKALRGAWSSTWALLSGSVSSKLSKRPPRRSSLTGIQRPFSLYKGRILQDETTEVVQSGQWLDDIWLCRLQLASRYQFTHPNGLRFLSSLYGHKRRWDSFTILSLLDLNFVGRFHSDIYAHLTFLCLGSVWRFWGRRQPSES